MNVTVLIDAIVRQTTVLIAELATSRGLRAPLAHVADEVFLELSRELESQGLSRKVTADMFGLALRTYQRKVQRLQESASDRGRTLWDAVYGFVRGREVVSRTEVMQRFRGDDEVLVRGVLNDLVESGLVFATGPTQSTTFRAATESELGAMARPGGTSDALLWVLVCRTGPVTAESLATLGRGDVEEVRSGLDRLRDAGRVVREERDGQQVYRTATFFVPIGSANGSEAAIFDHFHAVVRTIVEKVRIAAGISGADDRVGGSTYGFEIWQGHPHEEDVLGFLRRFREEHSELRAKVRTHNRAVEKPPRRRGVVVYGGQCHWEIDDESREDG